MLGITFLLSQARVPSGLGRAAASETEIADSIPADRPTDPRPSPSLLPESAPKRALAGSSRIPLRRGVRLK